MSFVRRENKQILESVNFVIKKGDNIGIKGLSGSGKTTFVDIICGLLKPSSGSLILNEKIELKDFTRVHTFKDRICSARYIFNK